MRRYVAAILLAFTALLAIDKVGGDPPDPTAAILIKAPAVPAGDVPAVDEAALRVGEVVTAERLGIEAAVAIETERLGIEAAVAIETERRARPPARPAPAAAAAPSRPVVTDGDIWWRLALCECGGNPACNTGNGFYGTFQFLLSTWRSVGGEGYPHEHSYEEQKLRAQILQARAGWGQWPACARELGLR